MKQIQQKIGATPDGIFGPNTAKKLMEYMRITPKEASHFIGQCWVESQGFRKVEENLNYSEKRILEVFPKYFTPEQAKEYVGHPKKIGDRVYANRMGNGNEGSGDGSKYKGRGFIQLTGKRNYSIFADYVGDPRALTDPERVATIYPLESARFYFDTNGLWRYCDNIDQRAMLNVSRLVNVGRLNTNIIPHKLREREYHTKKAYQWLTS